MARKINETISHNDYIEVILTRGMSTLISKDDWDYIKNHKWFFSGRSPRIAAVARVEGIKVYLHNFLMRPGDQQEVDHINHDRLDNRRQNLRLCNRSQNCANKRSYKNTYSKFKGVTWHKRQRKWIAQIKVNQKIKHLGSFVSEDDAARTYDVAARKYFGQFALTNEDMGLFDGKENSMRRRR